MTWWGKSWALTTTIRQCAISAPGIQPVFTREVVETKPDGSRIVRNESGALIVEKDGAGSIPMEVGHTLVDRASWEKEFLPRLQWSDSRADEALINSLKAGDTQRQTPLGLHAGSLLGTIRDWLGVEELCYLYMDDYDLYKEIIDTVGELSYRAVKRALSLYTGFDYLHFWEDICFKTALWLLRQCSRSWSARTTAGSRSWRVNTDSILSPLTVTA